MTKNLTIAAVAAAGVAAFAPASQGFAQGGTGVPIIVMAEDSDKNSVKRSSDIFYRVVSEMQEQFAREGFWVIDESFLAAELDWTIRDRRPRQELAEVVKLACLDGDAIVCPRAMSIMKIRAFTQDKGFATKVRVRVSGDVFDRQTNAFLGSWEAPRMEFPAPAGCKGVCIEEVVGDKARDVAISVGTVLRNKLAPYNDAEKANVGQDRARAPGAGATASAAPVTDARGSKRATGLVNRYKINFRNFGRSELIEMQSIMTNEFPDFVKIDGITGPAENRIVNYASYAKSHKIDEWLHLMLLNLDYPEGNVQVTLRGDREFTVDRIVGTPADDPGYREYR
ncbi:MAG: hypothetical protein ACFB00_10345 [Parvularculaceae bacterium]